MLADIEAVVLAGGAGSRMSHEQPKPLTAVAGRSLIEHVLGMLAHAGFARASVALGHEAARIAARLELPLEAIEPSPDFHPRQLAGKPISLRLLDTGVDCDTGGRLGRLRPLLDRTFLLCWVDGLADLDFEAMLRAHRQAAAGVTVMAVQPEARFGELKLDDDRVAAFVEKPAARQPWIHGGISFVEPSVLGLIGDSACSWERDVLPDLAARGNLAAHRHMGHWACLDLPEDVMRVERLAHCGAWPWLGAPG